MESVTYARRDIRGCPNDSDITNYIVNKIQNPQNYKTPDITLHCADAYNFSIHKDLFHQTALMRNILVNAEAQYPGGNVDIFLPDLNMVEVQNMIQFLYTGEVDANDTPKLMSNLINIFGFSSSIVMNVTITCNLCHESSPYQGEGTNMEGFSCESCNAAAQTPPDVVNDEVTEEPLLSPNVEEQDQTLDVFHPDAPSSSNLYMKGFSLPIESWENGEVQIDMFSSDEEDLPMNDENENIIQPSDNSESLENRIGKDFSSESTEEPKDADIFKHPKPVTSSASDHTYASRLPEPKSSLSESKKIPYHEFLPVDIRTEVVVDPEPIGNEFIVEPEPIGTELNIEPDLTPGTSSAAHADDRKVTPLKIRVQTNSFQIVKNKPKRKPEIPDDDNQELSAAAKKPRKIKRISVKCKKCGQLVENVKNFLRHYEPHVDDEGLGDVEPVGNDFDAFWDCPRPGCQFNSNRKTFVRAHILSNHCLKQLLNKEGVTTIEELYDVVSDTT